MPKKRNSIPDYIKSVRNFVAIDVETTGLSALRGDRIIEIGAVVCTGTEICGEFHSLICVSERIHHFAQAVHGITNDMLIGKPKADKVMTEFKKIIQDNALVAHNAKFDVGFIRHELSRLNMELTNPYCCSLEFSRKFYPKLRDHKLETVYRHLFGRLPQEGRRHRALDDARLVANVWMEMRRR